MRRTTTTWTMLASLALCAWASPASAGLPEDLRALAFHPEDPDCYAVIYAEVGGGVVLTCDDGETFELLCSSAILGEINLDALQPDLAYTTDGHLLVGHFDGLFRGSLEGCGFERIEGDLGENVIRDVITDPEDPGRLYVVSSAGTGENGIHVSTDGGETWEPVGELEPFYFSALRFAPLPEGGQRMVVSLGKPSDDQASTEYFVRVSDDGGETFSEHPFVEAESMSLLGVDQQEPDRFYALATPAGEDREVIYVNAQAGEEGAWERVGEVEKMGSFVTPADGGFWAVDVLQRQLLRSEDGTSMEAVEGEGNFSCFAQRPSDGQTFVCQATQLYEASDQGQAMGDPLLDLFTLGEYVQCEDPVDAQCQAQLSAGWCGHHFVDAPVCGPSGEGADAGAAVDGGGGTAGQDAGAPPGGGEGSTGGDGGEQGDDDGGGCTAAGRATAWPLGVMLSLVAWALVRRRRRAPARRPGC